MVPHEPLDQLDRLGVDDLLVVFGAEAGRDRAREPPLVEPVPVVEADRERLHRLPDQTCHQRHDRARVDPAAQKRSQRHVRDQPSLDRPLELRAHLPRGLVEPELAMAVATAIDAGDVELPVALEPRVPTWRERQHVRGGHALDAGEECVRARHVPERQVRRQRPLVELARHRRVREHSLDLAREHQRRAVRPVVERLFADPVAAQEEPLAGRVPDREREHAVELLRQRDRVQVLREMGDHLGVAVAGEPVPGAQQLVAQLQEVVDLAVENDAHGAVLVGDRWVAGLYINNRQAVLGHDRRPAQKLAGGVRTPMPLTRELFLDRGSSQARGGRKRPRDAAH